MTPLVFVKERRYAAGMAVLTRPFSPAYEAATASPAPARATPADAFRAGRKTWLTGERLDMAALAASLGISRPTLYKWCGDREQLLTDIIWSITESTFERALRETEGLRGTERVLAVARQFLSVLAASAALRAYVRNETHAAIRLLTKRGGFQDRLVDKVAVFLAEERARGNLATSADARLVAYAIVRVSEGAFYNDAIAAVDPRLDDAALRRATGPGGNLPDHLQREERTRATAARRRAADGSVDDRGRA
jgi:AcrR family transcriptional regulator